MEELLEMKGITKRFPGVIANRDVNFDLVSGEVHALLGENSCWVSTLMNFYLVYTNLTQGKFSGWKTSGGQFPFICNCCWDWDDPPTLHACPLT